MVSLQYLPGPSVEFNTSLEIVDSVYKEISSQPNYFKRDDSPQKQAYDKAKCAGAYQLHNINQDFHVGRSQFRDFDDLEHNGWTYSEPSSSIPEDLNSVFAQLAISTDERDWTDTSILQDEEFSNRFAEGNEPTYAEFDNIIHVRGRAIIATYNHGPAFMLEDVPQQDVSRHIPALSRWSDVIWLAWEKRAGDQAGQLEYVIRHLIDTPETEQVIEHVLALAGIQNLGGYPGIQRGFDTDDGLALLGTPHFKGVGWLLYDHRDRIQKKVDFARIWTFRKANTGETFYNMLIKLK